MIFKDSRYATGNITKAYRPANDDYQVVVYRTFPTVKSRYSVYTWKEQDRIDLVAKQFLGAPNLWWKIMDFNPEVINPFDISPGTTLRIPNV